MFSGLCFIIHDYPTSWIVTVVASHMCITVVIVVVNLIEQVDWNLIYGADKCVLTTANVFFVIWGNIKEL